MAYGDFKDLTRRTASDKTLRDKALNIDKNPKYDGYQRGLVSVLYKFYIKNLLLELLKMKICLITNYLRNQLLENLGEEKNTHLL